MLVLLAAMLHLFDVYTHKRHDIFDLIALAGILTLLAIVALCIAVLYKRRKDLTFPQGKPISNR